MGMVNQLGKFSATTAELSQTLKNFWQLWGPAQDSAFEAVKAELACPTTLVLCNQDAQTKDFRRYIGKWPGSCPSATG